MKKGIFTMTILVVFTVCGYAQIENLDKIPKQQSLVQNEANYRLTIEWFHRDVNNGNVLLHNIVSGQMLQVSPNDTVRLQDVSLTEISGQGRNSRKLDELQGLKFKIEGDNFTNPDFYKDFPLAQVDLIRWFTGQSCF